MRHAWLEQRVDKARLHDQAPNDDHHDKNGYQPIFLKRSERSTPQERQDHEHRCNAERPPADRSAANERQKLTTRKKLAITRPKLRSDDGLMSS